MGIPRILINVGGDRLSLDYEERKNRGIRMSREALGEYSRVYIANERGKECPVQVLDNQRFSVTS